MKVTVRHIRAIVRAAMLEWAGAPPNKQEPFVGDSFGSGWTSREALASLKDHDVDTEEGDELPPHLREPLYDEDDCYGPVPPNRYYEPTAHTDPYTRDTSPLPTGGIRRG